MRFASWNVESIRAHHDQVVAWVEAEHPDVICLQETRADERRFPRSAFAELGYALVIHGGDGGRGGVAIASRIELGDVALGIPGAVAPLDEPRSISATAAGVRIHTCYAPNGRKTGTDYHRIKLAWFSLFSAWLAIDRAEGVDPERIVLGDLNIAPDDLDVWDASRYRRRNLTSAPEREVFATLIEDNDLVDSIRSRLGDDRAYTWWNRRSDFYETDRGWRLDHVLASPSLDARIRSISIDRAERGRQGAADHAPILVEFAPQATRP